MYDFFLKINSSSNYNPYSDNDYYESRETESIYNHTEWSQLSGQIYDIKKSYLDNPENTIWIYGNIFLRQGCSIKPQIGSLLDNVLFDLNSNINIHSKYKGNYCIFCLYKKEKTTKIINSQLGLSHIYYYHRSNEFYVGNNLNHFKYLGLNINMCSIYQKLLFTYVISDDTFISGVKRVRAGEMIEFSNGKLSKIKGYALEELFGNSDKSKFSIDKYIYLFNNSVSDKANSDSNINVSFTGGFDGRTIISSLINSGKEVNAYSFGKYNGENTRIPLGISEKIGISYNPVYLEEEYERNYVNDAKKAIYFSDGISFNERANYIYAFRKLSRKSRFVLSGLMGGETLRPIHLRTDYMNENYYQIIYNNNNSLIKDYFSKSNIPSALMAQDENSISELYESVYERQKEIGEFKKSDSGFLYYLYDLLSVGFRMYYGTEIHLERQYCNNLTPYYDIDLLEYLFSTDYTEVFRQAFKSGKIHRWGGQKIYARIIKSNFNYLNLYPVDRGYPPGYLLNPLKLPLIPYLYYRRKRNRVNHIDFDETRWSKLFLEDFINNNYESSVFNNEALKVQTETNIRNNVHSSDFNRLLSLQTWLNQ